MQIKSDPDLPEDENPQEEPEVYAVHWQGGKPKISRRNLLKAGGVLMAGAALAGCAPGEETTIEPEPTNTPIPTTTSTPTPTAEPTKAVQDWNCEIASAHENPVSQLAFTPDGSWIVSRGQDESFLKLWSFPDSEIIKILGPTDSTIKSFDITPNGEYVFAVVQSGLVIAWSLPDGEEVTNFPDPGLQGPAHRLFVSPDSGLLVITDELGHLKILEIPSWAVLYEFEQPGASQLFIEFSPQNRYIVAFSYDSDATIWSLADGKEIITIPSAQRFDAPVFTGDDAYFVFPSDWTVNIYSLPDGQVVKTLIGHQAPIMELVILELTNQLITGDLDGIVKIWSIEEGVEEYSWNVENVGFFTVNEEMKVLVNCDYDVKAITLHSLYDGSVIESFDYEEGYGWVEFSPNNQFMNAIISDYDADLSTVKLYSLGKRALLTDLSYQGYVVLTFDPTNRFLLVGDELGRVKLFSTEGGQEISCMVDIAASGEDLEGISYEIEVEGKTVTYTLPCGSPIPPGAVCVCNCVAGSGCACVGHATCSCVGDVCSCVGDVCSCVSHSSGCSVVYHYWYPN